jgi:transcriptional regulator with XRE-family HTH domain
LSSFIESGTLEFMLQAAQLRAARALLGWRQEDLAKAAKIGLATIARIERGTGVAQGHVSTIVRLQETLEAAGVGFIEDNNGFGVRLSR